MNEIIWIASSEFGTYRLCEQRKFRRACTSAQSRQNLRCSLIQTVSQKEPSDRKPDPWPLWMAGHAQLKFVMTECSKTQIRLTGLIYLPKAWSAQVNDIKPLHQCSFIWIFKKIGVSHRKRLIGTTPFILQLEISKPVIESSVHNNYSNYDFKFQMGGGVRNYFCNSLTSNCK